MSELEDLKRRYAAAMHAVQTGVAMTISLDNRDVASGDKQPDSGSASSKHLRTGIDSALVSNGALTQLLIEKGVITELEFWAKLAEFAEDEAKAYESELRQRCGGNITLR